MIVFLRRYGKRDRGRRRRIVVVVVFVLVVVMGTLVFVVRAMLVGGILTWTWLTTSRIVLGCR